MKRNRLLATAKSLFAVFASTLFFVGCEGLFPADDEPLGTEEITISASTESTPRTTLNSSDEVVWQNSDCITLFDATGTNAAGVRFSLQEGAGTTRGSFKGLSPEWGGATFAYYGFAASAPFTAVVPAQQSYVAGGFAMEVNPMVARCDNLENGLSFRNVAGIIELQITGTQTLSSIEVSAEESLSGFCTIDSSTLDITAMSTFADTHSVVLSNINEELDASTAKSFKLVVLPGTYTNLTVKMVHTEGRSVTLTAAEEIVVERSKITPIAGLVCDNASAEVPKYVTLSIIEERTNWHTVSLKSEMSEEATSFLFTCGADSSINEWLNDNPDKDILDMLVENGNRYSEDTEMTYSTSPGIIYHFYAIALNASLEMIGDVFHLEHTAPAIPYDDALTVDISIPEGALTENSIEASLTPTLACDKLHVSIYEEVIDTLNAPDVIFRQVAIYPTRILEGVGAGEAATVLFNNLTPDTSYYIYVVAISTEGNYSHLTKKLVATPAHETSAATATLAPVSISDFSAKFSITLSEGSTGYKYAYFPKAEINNDNIAAYANEIHLQSSTLHTESEILLRTLTEKTEYSLLVIAYDTGNNYGELARCDFTTTDIVADANVPGYSNMLGEWAVSYYNNNDVLHSNAFVISFEQDIEGKTYTIKGLSGAGVNAEDSGIYDAVSARFYGSDHPINIDGSRNVVMNEDMSQTYDIHCNSIEGQKLFYKGPQIWDNGDGSYSIGVYGSTNLNGYTFGVFDKSGNFVGTYAVLAYNVTIRRAVSSEQTSTTEAFSRGDTLTPTWSSLKLF